MTLPSRRCRTITSKHSTKAQTTIPLAVRTALRLNEGDEIAYAIEGGRVTIGKVATQDPAEDPFGTFGEWASDADCRAYDGL